MSIIHIASKRVLLYGEAGYETMLYDEFTESDGVLLTTHTPDIGRKWENVVGDFDIQETHASGKTLPAGYAFVKNELARPAQDVFSNWRNVNDFAHLRTCFRVENDDNYWYVDKFTNGNVIKLYKKVSTSSSELDSASVTIANTTWYALWIDITGNLVEVYHAAWGDPPTKPETPILSAVDSALASSRGVGMYAANAGQWWDKFTANG